MARSTDAAATATGRHRPHLARRAIVAAAALAAVAPMLAGAAGAVERPAALFAQPSAIASLGPWVVVADQASSTLTILDASGALVRDVGRSTVGVAAPTALVTTTVRGQRLALVAGTGGHVAVLALTTQGTSVAVSRLAILRPTGCARLGGAYLATAGSRELVEACQDGAVTVWNLVGRTSARTIPASTTRVTNATGLAVLGGTADLTNAQTTAAGSAADGVTQLSLTTGKRLRTVTDAQDAAYAFSSPAGISSDGTNLWEINQKGATVDELSGTTLRFLGTSSTNLSDPGVVLATPSDVWVTSGSWTGGSSMVTQFQVVGNALESPWMMCNSNDAYHFDNPSGLTLHGTSLWVANVTDDLVDQMSATSGKLLGTYT